MSKIKIKLLWVSWFICLAIALLAIVIFIQGILRDTRAGEPVVPINFSSVSDWVSEPFRIWSSGRYRLFISSVNHEPKQVGAPLEAVFEVKIMNPDNRVYFQKIYTAGSTGLVLPQNYGDASLEVFKLSSSPMYQWKLMARVLSRDSNFATAHSQLKFWKERPDVGMGGLINYAMIVPAGLFLILSIIFSHLLAAHGSRIPIIITLTISIVFFGFFMI